MVLLTSLLALSLMNGRQADGSLLSRVVPIPTGKNGYEDYLRAADMAGKQLWGSYENWLGYRQSVGSTGVRADEEVSVPPIPPGVNPDMSDLAVRKIANERLGGAYEIIRVGNLKAVYDPRRDLSVETMFPEFAQFKMLAKIGINKAYVEFSEGRTDQAVGDLLEGLKFSRSIFGGTLISSLVSIGMQAIFLSEFQRHLGQLSYSDARLIDRTCKSLLDTPYPLVETYKREYSLAVNSVDHVIDNPSLVLEDEIEKAFGPAIQNLSEPDKHQLKGLVLQGLQSRYDALLQELNEPGSSLVRGRDPQDPPTALDDKSVSNLALAMLNALRSKSGNLQIHRAIARGKVQLMLLRLHAKVIQYHWQNYRWPTKIEEFADASSGIDPYSEQPFHYELKEGSYRLYSTGVPGFGPIELKYRPLPTPQDSGPVPPLL